MIGLDTKVVVRWLTADQSNPRQIEAAATVIESSTEDLFLNNVMLTETCWVLASRYRHSRASICLGLRTILSQPRVKVQDAAIVASALDAYEMGGAGFSDHLIGAINAAAGCRTTLTFDKSAGKGPLFTHLT